MSEDSMSEGWYVDPAGQGDVRYWNGTMWTATVSRDGATSNVALDPMYAGVPPVPGTEIHLPPLAPDNRSVARTTSRRSPVVAIVGMLVALVAIVVLVIALSNDDGSDTSPGTDDPPATAPPETDAPPATEAPADG